MKGYVHRSATFNRSFGQQYLNQLLNNFEQKICSIGHQDISMRNYRFLRYPDYHFLVKSRVYSLQKQCITDTWLRSNEQRLSTKPKQNQKVFAYLKYYQQKAFISPLIITFESLLTFFQWPKRIFPVFVGRFCTLMAVMMLSNEVLRNNISRSLVIHAVKNLVTDSFKRSSGTSKIPWRSFIDHNLFSPLCNIVNS